MYYWSTTKLLKQQFQRWSQCLNLDICIMKSGYFRALCNKASCLNMTEFLFRYLQGQFSSCRGRCSWTDRTKTVEISSHWNKKLSGFWAAAVNRISCRQAYIMQITKSLLRAVSRSHLSTGRAARPIRSVWNIQNFLQCLTETSSADPHTDYELDSTPAVSMKTTSQVNSGEPFSSIYCSKMETTCFLHFKSPTGFDLFISIIFPINANELK